MIRVAVAVIGLVLLSHDSRAEEPTSSQMKDFAIHQCSGKACAHARAAIGLMSLTQDLLAAKDVQVDFDGVTGVKRLKCDSFTFTLVNQLMICNNEKSASYTIDADVKVRTFLSQAKN